MTDALEGMTQERWSAMSERQREELRDLSGLSPQLKNLEGYRVEVITKYGEKRRFIVGRSTGWRPCNLEIPRRNSSGGGGAERQYKSVRILERVR